MDKAEAAKKIDQLVKDAYKSINEAEVIATEHNLEFSFGVAYGMGGHFTQGSDDYMWVSSSEGC